MKSESKSKSKPGKTKQKRKTGKIEIAVHIFILLVIGVTAYLGYEAYKTSHVDLVLNGESEYSLTVDEDFKEPGFSARHCVFYRCYDLTGSVVVLNPNANDIYGHKIGEYSINYTLSYLGETYSDFRSIKITDTTPPELTLEGDEIIGLYVGEDYDEPGFSAKDEYEGDLTDKVEISGEVDTSTIGVYTLKYHVEDSSKNADEKTRKIFVYNYSARTSEPIATFEEFEEYVEDLGLDISFGFRNLENGFEYTHNPDKVYYGASLVKTLDALYIYEQFGGPRDWNEYYLLQNAISFSNNSAHVSLAYNLGIANLRNYAESIGMLHHLESSETYADTVFFSDTTVSDQLIEWSHLWELTRELPNGNDLRQYFLDGYYATMNFYGCPPIMFKAGFYADTHHESAIVLDDEPYVFTVLTLNGYRADREIIMRDLSERVYLLNQTI